MNDSFDLYRPKLPPTFGTAEWANLKDLRLRRMLEVGLGKNMGPLLGCLTPAEIGGHELRYIYANGDFHLVSFGTTGSGKNRGQILTNLLWYEGSMVVLDFKGENWERTAGWRQANGHRVRRFAPFGGPGSIKWNLIDYINRGCGDAPNNPDRQERADFLAKLMIPVNANAKEPYFDNAATTLLQGLMIFVATAPIDAPIQINDKISIRLRERTMAEVLRLMAQDPIAFKNTLSAMMDSPEDWVRQTAATMFQMEVAREQSASVKTVLLQHLTVWRFRRIQEVTAETTFNFSELRGEQPTTLYIDIPFEDLSAYRNVLRVMIGACMRELRQTWSASKDENRPPVLMMLDEFPQLGSMEPIAQALLYMRSYAVKFWFFRQGIGDLQKHYPDDWRSFMSNCSKCFYGVDDNDTAKLVSEMVGSSTVKNHSYQDSLNEGWSVSDGETSGTGSSSGWGAGGYNHGSSSFSNRTLTTTRSGGSGRSSSLAYIGRPLIMPDEVLRMPFGSMFSLVRGMPAIRGQLRFWDEDVEGFRKRGLISPP